MPITNSDFNLKISPNPISSVLGMSNNFDLLFSNTNTSDDAYNLGVTITLPDGVSFLNSTVNPTEVVTNPDNTMTLSWTNIKNLVANEIDYMISITLKSDETFRSSSSPVPFDIPLSSIDILANVDTLPRGDDDTGNVKITKSESINFIPLRYNIEKSAPSKQPKGAGSISPSTNPRWPYTYTITIYNNTREPSSVTIMDNLPNGVKYLNNLNVSGPDSSILSNPTIIAPSPGSQCQNFVSIDWGNVTLSKSSTNIVTFNAAIWDNYTLNCIENSGNRIPHNTKLANTVTLDGLSGPVQGSHIIIAKDATVNKSVSSRYTDVENINIYTLMYRINQYDNVDSFNLTDILSDGQSYIQGSASQIPNSIVQNWDGTTTLIWDFGSVLSGDTVTVTFEALVESNYLNGNPVSANDSLTNNSSVDGINQTTFTQAPDSSNTEIFIFSPSIQKELLNYYYKDGSLKNIDIASPGDEVGFRITYDSTNTNATQLNIEIDEFAPLNMGPLTDTLSVNYSGTLPGPFNPFTISPNGLRWVLGDLPKQTVWIANFKVPVNTLNFVGTQNNLAVLKGVNTDQFAYSDRDQVVVKFGAPNILFNKTVSGPTPNEITAGEIYTYSIKVSNPQNAENTVTDAFEMELTDVIPDGLIYNNSFNISGTGVYDNPIFNGQNVSMLIKKLAPNEDLTLSFDVLVTNNIVSGQTYTNNAELQRPYSQPDKSYQFPGKSFKASKNLKAKGITLQKTIVPCMAKIGDTVTYTIRALIPKGVTAYNVEISDDFPSLTQSYIQGSATKDGLSITPSIRLGLVTFPTIPFVDATLSETVITYTFDVRITGVLSTPPYTEDQIDNATVDWDVDPFGTSATPFMTSEILKVISPNIVGKKEQRNITQNTDFTDIGISYDVGDTIEYRLTLTNNGDATAFDIILTDIINRFLNIITSSIITTDGFATELNNVLTWRIQSLNSMQSATITFKVLTLSGVGSNAKIPNVGSFVYNSNNNGFGIDYKTTYSNTVYISSPFVDIVKTASLQEAQIGDPIVYTLTLTIPRGTIAYTPLVEDILPIGQTYIGPSTRQLLPDPIQTVTPGISGQKISFPINPDIDASLEEITLIYTFIARVTSATHVDPFEETQENLAYVKWGIVSGGPLDRLTNAYYSLVAQTPNIKILKEQKNVTQGGSYTTNDVSAIPTDVVYYRLVLTSNGASPAFNIILTDLLQDNLIFNSIVSGPTTGVVTPPSSHPNARLTWTIDQLDNNNRAVLEFAVSVKSGIGSGSSILNNAGVAYDSNDISPITYEVDSNVVQLNVPSLQVNKSVSNQVASIGDILTYTLTIPIPDGVVAYNLSIEDILPIEQTYINGSWSPGVPTVNNNLIQYSSSTNPETGPQTLVFTFNARVDSGITTSPYTQTQTNAANILWDILPGGKRLTTRDSVSVEIKTPNIVVEKEQRNFSTGGSFTTKPLIDVAASDFIDYKLTITNNGSSPAYGIITTDILDSNLKYVGVQSPLPPGTIVESPLGTITWSENILSNIAPDNTLILIFRVQAVNSIPVGTSILNFGSTTYNSSTETPSLLGPSISNNVSVNYNVPTIEKTSDKTNLFIGDEVIYTVNVIIPAGNVAYNVQLIDVFPNLTQSYVIGSSSPTAESVIDGTITFESVPFVDASDSAVTLIYTFKTIITSATISPEDTQTNTATVNWDINNIGSPGTPQIDTAQIFVSTNQPKISKSQRNITQHGTGEFTKELIASSIGDIIYYRFDIENSSSTNTLYNVNLVDTIDSSIKALEPIILAPNAQFIIEGNLGQQVVKGSIPSIPPNTTYVAIISVKVIGNGFAKSTIPNKSSITYSNSSSITAPVYGPINSNTVEIELPGLAISKDASPTQSLLGDIITYIIKVTVPNGTIANNIVVTDILPDKQIYIGEATLDSTPILPNINGQNIQFSPISIDATSEEVTIEYKFKARVIDADMSSSFIETQTDSAQVVWEIDSMGTLSPTISVNKDILVSTPSLLIEKEHRNATQNTAFQKKEISANTGDLIEYKLIASNTGIAPAFNIIVNDPLDMSNEFIQIVSVSYGSYTIDTVTNILTWTIDQLDASTSQSIVIQVKVLEGAKAGDTNSDTASATVNTNTTTPITLGPFNSNNVIYHYPTLSAYCVDCNCYVSVGNCIAYTVNITLPKGTTLNDFILKCVLPASQSYKNNATLDGVTIVPSNISFNTIEFPVIPFLFAKDNDLILQYKFYASIIDANVDPITLTQTQSLETIGIWSLDNDSSPQVITNLCSVEVTDSSVETMKKQRNTRNKDNFTIAPVNASKSNIIEYELIITNTGPNIVYDVLVEDLLSPSLSFVKEIYVSTGSLNHSGELSNGLVTFSIPKLSPGESANAIFSVEIVDDTIKFIQNNTTTKFLVDQTNPNKFTAPNSNTTVINILKPSKGIPFMD